MNPKETHDGVAVEQGPLPIDEPEFAFDPNQDFNGMYASEADFKAAEAMYTMPPSINTLGGFETTNNEVTTIETNTQEYIPAEPSTEKSAVSTLENSIDDNVIEGEAVEVPSAEETLENETEEVSDIEEVDFDTADTLEIEGKKLNLTPKLRSVAKGVLSTIEGFFTSNDVKHLETIDFHQFLMTEPDYEEDADYELLLAILKRKYEKKRRLHLASYGSFNPNQVESLYSRENTAPESEIPPPETPPPPLNTVEGSPEDDIIDVEFEKVETEVPLTQIEQNDEPPALTYQPESLLNNTENPALEDKSQPLSNQQN